MDRNTSEIPSKLREAILNATVHDMEFYEEDIPGHYESEDVKTGYRPKSILGMKMFTFPSVAYIKSEDSEGICFYIVSQSNSPVLDKLVGVKIFEEEERVKEEVLAHLRMILGDV